MFDTKLQGNTPPHGRTDEDHSIQSELDNKLKQHCNGFTLASWTLTKTRHINGKNMQAQSGQKIKGTKFLPGSGLKFHPVQENNGDSRRIAALQTMQRKPVEIDIFYYHCNHFIHFRQMCIPNKEISSR